MVRTMWTGTRFVFGVGMSIAFAWTRRVGKYVHDTLGLRWFSGAFLRGRGIGVRTCMYSSVR